MLQKLSKRQKFCAIIASGLFQLHSAIHNISQTYKIYQIACLMSQYKILQLFIQLLKYYKIAWAEIYEGLFYCLSSFQHFLTPQKEIINKQISILSLINFLPDFITVHQINFAQHDNVLQLKMSTIDDYFQEVAFSMGFKPEDLLPIDREVIQLQSVHLTKGMSQKQKQFYINKKMVSLLQRQNKIFKQVQTEIKRRQFTYKLSADHKSRIHNPAIVKILTDHEKLVSKNKRYLDNLFRKKAIDKSMEVQRQLMTSQKYRRTEKSLRSNTSSVSNRSSKTGQSNRSSLLNQSNASDKERLRMVRQKEKEELQMRKALLRHKQQQDSRKSLRASQNSSRVSQRVKTRSAVNKQVVDQNKRQLQFIKNAELKSHLQQLKYKMQKTELIRSKNHERKELRQKQANYKEIKKMMEEQNKKLLEYRYNQKLKTASLRVENQNLIKSEARNFNRMTQNLKLDNAKKNRQLKNSQDNQFLNNVMKYEQLRMQTAQINRNKLQDLQKQKFIKREIKQEIAKKNLQSVTNRRYQETQQVQRKIYKKIEDIQEIAKVKKQLSKERQKIKQQTTFYRRSLEVNHNRIKINSFFNL